ERPNFSRYSLLYLRRDGQVLLPLLVGRSTRHLLCLAVSGAAIEWQVFQVISLRLFGDGSSGQKSRRLHITSAAPCTPDLRAGSKFGLGTDFAKSAREAGLPDRCRLHGLKKGGMRRGADAGLTTHELQSHSGHRTPAEVQRYTKGADQKRLARSAW